MEDFSYLLISLLMVAVGLSLGLPFYLRRRDGMQSGPSAHTKEEALAEEISGLQKDLVAAQTSLDLMRNQLSESKQELASKQSRLIEEETELTASKSRMEESKKAFD